jgi:Ohr subfamily peroxiredoxin
MTLPGKYDGFVPDRNGAAGAISPGVSATCGVQFVMPIHVLYAAEVVATGGRDGTVVSTDGHLDLTLGTPRELGGDGNGGSNPEQLFGGAYAACFLGSMKFVASEGGPQVPTNATVTAIVGIGPRFRGGFRLDVQLDIALPGLTPAEADLLVQQAHRICPYSHAIHNNVAVRLILV